LDFDFKWLRFMRDESEELMASTCKSLPLRGLRGLSLSTDIHEIETKTWIRTFADLPALFTVRLHGQSTQFIAALGEDVVLDGVKQIPPAPVVKPIVGRRASLRRPRAASVSGGLFFPALRNLIFEDTDFADPVLDQLEDALMERCERKQDLWSLTLQDCSRLRHGEVERLENIVPEVVWDGMELGFTDDESEVDMSEYGDFYSSGLFFDIADGDYSDYDYPMF
jgi:hypothetical protein